jgi:hypothetical protein
MKTPIIVLTAGFAIVVYGAVQTLPTPMPRHEIPTNIPQQTAETTAVPTLTLPQGGKLETDFIKLVRDYAAQYASAPNDMAKGAARVKRAAALRALFQSMPHGGGDWVGEVTELSSTSSGKGILTVKIADGITMGTTNNEFSDSMGEPTLIMPDTPVYGQAVQLHEGEYVSFKGNLVMGKADWFLEMSLLQHNSMTRPHWNVRFTSVTPLQGQQAKQ